MKLLIEVPTETDSPKSLRDELIRRRNEALGPEVFNANDAVFFSHVIKWFSRLEKPLQVIE